MKRTIAESDEGQPQGEPEEDQQPGEQKEGHPDVMPVSSLDKLKLDAPERLEAEIAPQQQEHQVVQPAVIGLDAHYVEIPEQQDIRARAYPWKDNFLRGYFIQGVTKLGFDTLAALILLSCKEGDQRVTGCKSYDSNGSLFFTGAGALMCIGILTIKSCSVNSSGAISKSGAIALTAAGTSLATVDLPAFMGSWSVQPASYIVNSIFILPAVINYGPAVIRDIGNKLKTAAHCMYRFFRPAAQQEGDHYRHMDAPVENGEEQVEGIARPQPAPVLGRRISN